MARLRLENLFKKNGATGVSPVEHERGRSCPHKNVLERLDLRDFRRMGRILGGITVLVILAGCRQDMHDQPRFKPLAQSDFYPDLRSERQPVDGTVARGQLHEDTYFYTGMVGDKPGDYMPFPVTQEVLDRGRERFDIYCAPCHSRLGDGNGMVPSRGFQHPPTYHSDRLRKAPLGYFFYVMTTGFGAMPDYAEQVPPRDRWCIVAYIRALQLSQNATQADVGGHAVPSPAPQLEEPGSGATPPVPLPHPTAVEGVPVPPPPSTEEGNPTAPAPGGGKKER